MLHADALHGNPYDGHTLGNVLTETADLTGVTPKRAFVDKGYRGHKQNRFHFDPETRQDTRPPWRVFTAGRKALKPHLKAELKRRPAIEPIIGHLKTDHRMDRNHLKGKNGDRFNVKMAAIGFNFRRVLAWLRDILRQFFDQGSAKSVAAILNNKLFGNWGPLLSPVTKRKVPRMAVC